LARAETLYIANMRLSGAAMESLHVFEVVVRNSIDAQLKKWNSANGGPSEWAMSPTPLLAGVLDARGKLTEAKTNAANSLKGRRPFKHDDVVAQLSLGTWRYLLPSKDIVKQKLWDEALESAFPHLYGSSDILKSWIEIAYDLRNRVAHFEPIFERDLRGKRRAIRDVINSVSKDARIWFLETDRLLPEIETFYASFPEFE
jgi:hypothetical protein